MRKVIVLEHISNGVIIVNYERAGVIRNGRL